MSSRKGRTPAAQEQYGASEASGNKERHESEPESEEEADSEVAEDFEYEGETDNDGNPHGRGVMRWSGGNTFEGLFEHGERNGEGCFLFADGGSLQGHWTDDGIHRVGLYSFPDGNFQEGVYQDGQLSGPCVEWDSTGFVSFVGHYKDGIRCGLAELREMDGGYLVGCYNDDEQIEGDNVIYVYPGGKYALKGTWEDGEMKSAKFCIVDRIQEQYVFESFKDEAKEPSSKRPKKGSILKPPRKLLEASFRNAVECSVHPDYKDLDFTCDESTHDIISSTPLLIEPLESILTYVAPSSIQGANEGLFAKVDLESDQLVSVYSGIRLTHEEVDSRAWKRNSNTITLDEDVVIDVPKPFDDTAVYCASLGHKVNHWPVPNAKYAPLCHPRFGDVKSIRTIKPIKAGEEILVRYDYQHTDEEGRKDIPDWYIQCESAHE